ncbi:MAG: PEGA domain-containing protein [Proteobacteria bacterium]|nr:PEGA domain-containing protein [Pseudomonadota bacterium]
MQLENDADVTVKLQEYTSATVDPKSQAVIANSYEHFNAGMKFYRKLDLTNSLKEFNISVRGYREGISILRDNHYLLFSHLYLGIILHFLGRSEEGKKFIQEMVMLDAQRKTRVLPARDFPPKIVDLHKQITREVLAKPVSTLTVDSTPSGARVMFDGSEVGKTPFQIKDIPSGQHFLSLDLQGYQYYGAPIQVNAGTQNFTTTLKEKNIFQIYPPEAQTEGAKSELKLVAEKLNVDILILGQTVLKDSNNVTAQAQMFDARNGNFTPIMEETVSTKKPKFKTLVDDINDGYDIVEKTDFEKPVVAPTAKNTKTSKPAKPLIKEVKEEKIKPRESVSSQNDIDIADFNDKSVKKTPSSNNESSPFYKKWWFWSIVGAAVVGGGAYYMLQDRSADSNIVTIPNPL